MSDLREMLSDIIFDFKHPSGEASSANELADAILDDPRIAVIQLPTPVRRFDSWSFLDPDERLPLVYVSEDRVEFGSHRWNTSEGDDPELLGAALIAANREARKS